MKLFISPKFDGVDKGYHGGIRRVVDAQRSYFRDILTEDFHEADIVAIHAGSLVPLKASQIVVAHCHGLYWNKHNWEGGHHEINKLVVQTMKLSDAITAPTEWVAEALRRGMCRPVDVIGHAVDDQWQPGNKNGEYVLWNKSRIDKVCSADPVYKVAKMLPDIEFKLTVGLQTSSNITITGLTPYADIRPVQEAGVYLATAQETFGIGILEALACGVPVCGWNWGGQAELIEHKVTGWLSPVGDYDDLAKGIQWCLTHNLRADCIQAAKKWTWEAACRKYEELYSKLSKTSTVSVVIRNYNTGKYLKDAILSAKDADEIIVVDDCSLDDSKKIFDSLDTQAKWIQTPRNLHLSGAQTYGMDHATGEYIVPLDADNMLAENAIKVLKQELEKDRSIDIAYGRIKFTKEDGETPDTYVSGARDGVSSWPPSIFRIERQLEHRNQIPCTVMMRRKVYEHTGPYRARCRVAEDADFWCRAVSLGFQPKLVTNAVTLLYRNREGTTSQTTPDWPWHSWYEWRNSPPMCSISNEAPNANSLDPLLVSVIVPVGPGHELTLQDTMDSLYMQTFKNWECIIVNDTGKTLPYTPPWAIVINSPGNVGTAMARNIGLSHARAKLWVPLDADDYLETDALEKFIRAYSRRGGYIYSEWKTVETHEHRKVPARSCDQLWTTMPHIVTGLYPVTDIRFDTSLDLLEDWDFAIQMSQAGYCGTAINEPLVYYRQGSGARRKLDSDEHRIALQKKWGDSVANCSRCGRRMNAGTPAPQNAGPVIMGIEFDQSQMTQLEYIGMEEKRYFPGKVTGQMYAFGTFPQHRIKWVWNADVQGFLDTNNWQVYAGELVTA